MGSELGGGAQYVQVDRQVGWLNMGLLYYRPVTATDMGCFSEHLIH